MSLVVATFYKFVNLSDCRDIQKFLLSYCQSQNIKGTILLAKEGINGTIAGTRQSIDRVIAYFQQDKRFVDLEYKESSVEEYPFTRLKVRLKKEIVTIGLPEVNPNQQVGTYIEAKDWNKIITQPDVLVIDTRNQYEVEIGTFRGAINPQTESFRQFPAYIQSHLDKNKHKKVAMFCTGGIRCEKASAYMLNQGFEEVYHLKGGILKYLEEVPASESLWQGECFVFDQRITVKEGLKLGDYQLCFSCGHPISPQDKLSPKYEEEISCPYCFDSMTEEKKQRRLEKKKQRQLTAK